MFYMSKYSSPIGMITLACKEEKLIGLWIDGQKYHGNTIFKSMIERNDLPIFDSAKKWLDRYFSGQKPNISELNLSPIGSEFRKAVWNELCEIPYGEVVRYGDIAKKLGCKSAQAIGGAVGHNPISIIIPCHRVVGSNGSLTGFASGVDTKIKLLELEEVDLSNFFIPKKGTAI